MAGRLSGTLGAADSLPPPLAFVFLLFASWVNREQQAVIIYPLEENRVLRTARRPRRLRVTNDQRRRLAAKGKVLGRRRLGGDRRHRYAGHHPAVVPPACGEET